MFQIEYSRYCDFHPLNDKNVESFPAYESKLLGIESNPYENPYENLGSSDTAH